MNDPVRVELKDFYLAAFEEFPTVSLLLAYYEQAIANVRQKKVIKKILPCSNLFLMIFLQKYNEPPRIPCSRSYYASQTHNLGLKFLTAGARKYNLKVMINSVKYLIVVLYFS